MIVLAENKEQLEHIRRLFREYERFLGEDLHFQKFEEELANLPADYGPPDGVLLLLMEDGKAVGCGALRRLDEGVCELKRLFIQPEIRGRGLGRQMVRRLIDEAVRLGYNRMVLDTLDRLDAANRLYRSMGFVQTEPYYHNPLKGVLYWELDLRKYKNR
ncbi:MAG TPA: GNAT family N-acetyltransferase [Caldithrix abyssi]|uniref:GNAT family N-acetyltransferase n=1 Tax=Caldithrix abyssi TaxID=187145 RepID=A0A7V4TYG0_CALAY|nr:GNAT family N-acetyltransferase [Caldithrix abyssi]